VDDKAVRRELRRGATAAGLPKVPTPNNTRHLFESLTEAARLAPGVVRFLMGHGIQRGDALHNYSHAWLDVLRQQVAELDALRKPLVDAMVRRAGELVSEKRTAAALKRDKPNLTADVNGDRDEA